MVRDVSFWAFLEVTFTLSLTKVMKKELVGHLVVTSIDVIKGRIVHGKRTHYPNFGSDSTMGQYQISNLNREVIDVN